MHNRGSAAPLPLRALQIIIAYQAKNLTLGALKIPKRRAKLLPIRTTLAINLGLGQNETPGLYVHGKEPTR
jgi:hypothetical protein